MTESCTKITECLACGNDKLKLILDFKEQPLANNFRATKDDKEPTYPLAVNRCLECHHLQLTHVVDPAIIYRHYLYVSGTSSTNKKYMEWYAKFVHETITNYNPTNLGPFTVLDVGCNDGSQLDAFKNMSFRTHGLDPAENLHPTSSAKHHVVCGFWDEESAAKLGTKFDVISSQNAFSHIPDPVAYLTLVKQYLKRDGLLFISTSQADMIQNDEFDTIYHEHISFYNAESMRRLAERTGFHLMDVIKTPIHGNSYIFILSHEPRNRYRLENILNKERIAGLQSGETYTTWAFNVAGTLNQVYALTNSYKEQGYHVIGYGAAAKGMTVVNAGNIKLDAIVDDNPLKQGMW